MPQFFPFHPALLAVGAGLFGPAGALFVTPLWGVLDIAALYFLARRLFDKNVALVASTFLTVPVSQIARILTNLDEVIRVNSYRFV